MGKPSTAAHAMATTLAQALGKGSRPMRRSSGGIIPGLLVVSILAGCSASRPTVLVKPGVTASQQKVDETACIEASIGAIQDPRPSPSSSMAVAAS
jgi:hypothetical protein